MFVHHGKHVHSVIKRALTMGTSIIAHYYYTTLLYHISVLSIYPFIKHYTIVVSIITIQFSHLFHILSIARYAGVYGHDGGPCALTWQNYSCFCDEVSLCYYGNQADCHGN